MVAPKLKKCRGLYTAPNRYDVPEGALVTANNVLIYKDGVIQPRWGLVPSATSMVVGNVSHWHRSAVLDGTFWAIGRDTSSSLMAIGYGSLSSFAGMSSAGGVEDGPTKYSGFSDPATPFFDGEWISIGNLLYLNTNRGLRRFENTSNYDIRAGGYPCAVSCFPRPLNVAIGNISRTGTTVTVTTDVAHGYTEGLKVTMTSAGEANFAAGEKTVVSVVSTTQFTYTEAGAAAASTAAQIFSVSNLVGASGILNTNDQVAYKACIVEYDGLGNEHIRAVSGRIVVSNSTPYVGTAALKNPQVAVIFPVSGPLANSKIELYRTPVSPNAEPSGDMGLVYSKFLTPLDISRGYLWVVDIVPDSQLDAKKLYTNETEDGELQNNLAPPGAKTVSVWGQSIVAANTSELPALSMKLLSVDATSGGLAAGDVLDIGYYQSGVGANYPFTAVASTAGFTDYRQFSVYTGGLSPTSDIQHTVFSLLDSLNWGPATPFNTGYVGIYSALPGALTGSFIIRKAYSVDQEEYGSTTVAQRTVSGKRTGTSNRGAFAPKLGAICGVSSASRAASVLTINTSANHNFVVGEYVVLYDSWTSQTQSTIVGTACEGQITAVTATSLTVSNAGSNGSAGSAQTVALKYRPLIQGTRSRNRLFVSKYKQWEAFPAANFVDVGAPQAHILKCVQCKDSLMVFKEDGLFRVTRTGNLGEVLSAELVDPNAILWAKDTAVAINGKIMAWLTKGVAIVNEQGVERYVSERIVDRLSPTTTALSEPSLLEYPYSRRAFAVVDEKNNLYELRVCLSANPSAPYASTVNVIYNIDNDTWVEDDLAVVSEVFYNGKRYIQQGTTFYSQSDQVCGGTTGTSLGITISPTAISTLASTYTFSTTGADPVLGTYLVSDLGSVGVVTYVNTGTGTGYVYVPAGVSGGESYWDEYLPVVCSIQWAPITFSEENKINRTTEVQFLWGVREQLTCDVTTSSDLVTTTETNTCLLDPRSTNVGVNGFAPQVYRYLVPQQHRVGQQLRVTLKIYTAYGPWTILGIGAEGDVFSSRGL